MKVELNDLKFRRIDFKNHSELCLKFRADSFFVSFGTDEAFWEEDGKGGERYLEWLQSKDASRYGSFHVWKGDQIIGQMELGLYPNEEELGYINLFYLAPEYRGKGYAKTLNDFALQYLKDLGATQAKLSVSPTNKRAWHYYLKHGWTDGGPRKPNKSTSTTVTNSVHWMVISI